MHIDSTGVQRSNMNPASLNIPSDQSDPPGEEEKPHRSETKSTDGTKRSEVPMENVEIEQSDGAGKKRRLLKVWKTFEEGQKSDWWFASTGIPLLAATLGPLANITSIVALVTSWRMNVYIDGQFVAEIDGVPFADPRWCYYLNVGSLICGFLGNVFLLFNFTQRIRYIIALPATIFFWYLATGFLIGITISMQMYAPPSRPYQTYTQGFWYAIAAASFYLLCSMLLMINMLGYFLGHYSDNFALSDSQRTLILQTMWFFIWLGGGAAMFMKIENDAGQNWSYADSLYFCDVTVLTVGFGDFYPTTNLGRGLIFPFSVGGIITLALIVSSIYKFMRELGEENIVMRHADRIRQRTADRTVTSSYDLRQRERAEHRILRRRSLAEQEKLQISAPTHPRMMRNAIGNTVKRATSLAPSALKKNKKPRLLLLKEEEDRFHAMREIQHRSRRYRKWLALVFSCFAYGILWCVGAIVFWQAEKHTQNMTYFQALYFGYVSLLTIGYGDLAPKSSAGRTFFVIWSLIAVPTMTILVSDLGDTVVEKFRRWSDSLADFTVLPKYGIWRRVLEGRPWLARWMEKRRVARGFALDDPDRPVGASWDAQTGAVEEQPQSPASATRPPEDHAPLTHHLALAIKNVAADLALHPPKRYTFPEWIAYLRLIRRTGRQGEEEYEEGVEEWDWIGRDSPLMSGASESEWLLGRLCESLVRVGRGEGGVRGGTVREEGAEGEAEGKREGAR